MMRFVVDAQLPPQLAGWLKARGHEAEHVGDRLGLLASDLAIVAHAALGVIVSKDADFVSLLESQNNPPQLLWIRIGNTTNRALFDELDKQWPRIEAELHRGAPIVEAH
jgi:predicted nuclease of predicted toxin-antitoxin system